MAVKSWMIGGAIINDCIYDVCDSCFERKDLISVPDILKYNFKFFKEENVYLYENNLGVIVVLFPYANFNDMDELDADYYDEPPNNKYDIAYNKIIQLIKKEYQIVSFDNLDWVMPIVEGESSISSKICFLSTIGTETKEYVALIDSSIIYTTVRSISEFILSIGNNTHLTRFERWKLAYYQRLISPIEKPSLYLTNNEEISLVTKYYNEWNISSYINSTLNNVNHSIELFSFLSEYENNSDNDLFSSFLTFFGIIVGLEAIYNLFTVLFENIGNTFKTIFVIVILLIVAIYAFIFSKKLIKHSKEKKEFFKKTKRKN